MFKEIEQRGDKDEVDLAENKKDARRASRFSVVLVDCGVNLIVYYACGQPDIRVNTITI